jgi:hypothetical protein
MFYDSLIKNLQGNEEVKVMDKVGYVNETHHYVISKVLFQ